MTTFRAPFNVLNGPLGTEATVISISSSGAANIPTFTAGSSITLNGDTTVQVTARSSADALLKITMNGTGYVIPVYSSAAY